jgi:nucleoside phosphorylase
LSEAGRARVREERLLYPDGLPPDPPIRVHVGTLVTTNRVVQDVGDLFEIKQRIRRVRGIDMEAAFFAAIARQAERRTVVVKAVAERIGWASS